MAKLNSFAMMLTVSWPPSAACYATIIARVKPSRMRNIPAP
jgi:hypothetical protein